MVAPVQMSLRSHYIFLFNYYNRVVQIASVAMQILMSVRLEMTTVMRMHSVLTQRGVSPAPAI